MQRAAEYNGKSLPLWNCSWGILLPTDLKYRRHYAWGTLLLTWLPQTICPHRQVPSKRQVSYTALELWRRNSQAGKMPHTAQCLPWPQLGTSYAYKSTSLYIILASLREKAQLCCLGANGAHYPNFCTIIVYRSGWIASSEDLEQLTLLIPF